MIKLRAVSRFYARLFVVFVLTAFAFRRVNVEMDGLRVPPLLVSLALVLAWAGFSLLGQGSAGPGIPRSSLKKLRFRPKQDL
jgi:hypothetical protein